jgi:hypothetical protein
VPDKRKHRGSHPDDARLFGPEAAPLLRYASEDLAWLLSKGYASPSSLKLVGDRYGLVARQRTAVARATCAAEEAEHRQRHQVSPADVAGCELWLDGYNVLTTVEAALSGGVILDCRDGTYRDMASMHGSYRKVTETLPALELIGETLAKWEAGPCRWLLDSPVSNSGRLKTIIRDLADQRGWPWEIELVPDPDAVLCQTDRIVATADSMILDGCTRWVSLAREVVNRRVCEAWILRFW